MHAVCVEINVIGRVLVLCLVILAFLMLRLSPALFGVLVAAATYLIIEASVLGCVRDYFIFFSMFKFNISDLLITLSTVGILLSGIKTSAWNTKN